MKNPKINVDSLWLSLGGKGFDFTGLEVFGPAALHTSFLKKRSRAKFQVFRAYPSHEGSTIKPMFVFPTGMAHGWRLVAERSVDGTTWVLLSISLAKRGSHNPHANSIACRLRGTRPSSKSRVLLPESPAPFCTHSVALIKPRDTSLLC